ncbi:MAG: sugar phosphate isomerase/epimerase family protein [Fuerstiella sp.]
MLSRRTFLAATAAAGLVAPSRLSARQPAVGRNPVCVFTKPFNSLTHEQLASQVAPLGFDGIEAPVRSGGHIEPEAVPEQLPELVQALAARNLEITVLTSDINDPADPLTEKVLTTASRLGIRYYRMKYFRYDENQSITQQIDQYRGRLKDLAAMNRQLNITALYQNHAGRNYFGAAVWDLYRALENIDPRHVGMAYDIRHATVESGTAWPIGFRLVRPHIQVVYVKDFVWGEQKPTNVPLGQGRVDAKFFEMLRSTGFNGPISLHEEYLDHRRPELVPQHWQAIAADFRTLKSWL